MTNCKSTPWNWTMSPKYHGCYQVWEPLTYWTPHVNEKHLKSDHCTTFSIPINDYWLHSAALAEVVILLHSYHLATWSLTKKLAREANGHCILYSLYKDGHNLCYTPITTKKDTGLHFAENLQHQATMLRHPAVGWPVILNVPANIPCHTMQLSHEVTIALCGADSRLLLSGFTTLCDQWTSKSHDTKTRPNIKILAWSNLNIVL